MYAVDDEVRYQIVDGFKWQIRDYHDEVVEFLVMKRRLRNSDMVWRDVLEKPETIKVLVDHVAAPLAAMKKPIRGKMAENAPRGLILPEFGDEIGLGLLKAGLEVEIDYGINERTGLLRFQVL